MAKKASRKEENPGREIALIALQTDPYFASDMLTEVILYAFDQLCWRRATPDLNRLLDELRALVAEDAA